MGAKLFKKKNFKILFVGVPNSGILSIIKQLRINNEKNLFNGIIIQTIKYKECNIAIWTYKNHSRLKPAMKNIYSNVDGIIYAVDSSDRDRIEDAAEDLKKFLALDEFKNCVILVMANKQDLNGALTPVEVTEKMGMGQLKGRTWLVQGTSCIIGKGIKEGLEWIISEILKKNKLDISK